MGKALDNIDLNLVSHRYVTGVLKDDHFVSTRLLTPRSLGVANGTCKIMGLAKFSFDLEILAAFAKSLEVLFKVHLFRS